MPQTARSTNAASAALVGRYVPSWGENMLDEGSTDQFDEENSDPRLTLIGTALK